MQQDNLLSVQCNAATEYKFTSVCMCPSHFLSTRLRIFTVDSLKDADLRKNVPFGVSMMNNHI